MMPLWCIDFRTEKTFRDIDGWKLDWGIFYSEGVGPEQREFILKKQDYGCAICGGINLTRVDLDVDHDHGTGEIRGLLCNRCNQLIGYARNSASILRIAALYLEANYIDSPIYAPRGKRKGEFFRDLHHRAIGTCRICGEEERVLKNGGGAARRLSVDHDHATGKVRGLLCRRCNGLLGLAYDSPRTLRQAAEYLELPPFFS
jgi:hypothetical protein